MVIPSFKSVTMPISPSKNQCAGSAWCDKYVCGMLGCIWGDVDAEHLPQSSPPWGRLIPPLLPHPRAPY